MTREPIPAGPDNAAGTADLQWVWGEGDPDIYIGSYAINGWLYDVVRFGANRHPEFMMSKQSEIQKSSLTPVFMDCMWVDLWPLETDQPVDLYTGVLNGVVAGHPGMERCAIMRHGGKTAATSMANFDISQRLPGSINIGMADGHVEFVPLENLWQYYWHKDWQPPSPRPGR